LPVIIRYVLKDGQELERFLMFVPIEEHNAQYLFDTVKYCNEFAGSISQWKFITSEFNTQVLITINNCSRILTNV
jgi:predicted P-loop ATPase/GTPase